MMMFVLLLLGLFGFLVFCFGRRCGRGKRTNAKCLIVLGSGGHTTEMLMMIQRLSDRYRPRTFVVTEGDRLSESKAVAQEIQRGKIKGVDFDVCVLPRPRRVGQSYLTSIFTTVHSLVYTIRAVYRVSPNAVMRSLMQILCNGPGICVPIIVSAKMLNVHAPKLKAILWRQTSVVYVESFARVRSLSLTGFLSYYFVDRFIVQWPQLSHSGRIFRGEYIKGLLHSCDE